MDTIPFHFLMFALDVVLVLGIVFWPSQRSTRRALVGWTGLCAAGLLGIGFFAVIFRSNLGQCAVEGITYHGSAFLLVAAVVLARKRRRRLGLVSALLGVVFFLVGFDMLVLEPYSLVVEHYTVETAKLKKPLRIVFVADIQTDRIGRHERRTLRLIQKQKADLILLGGDYLQYYPGTPGVDKLPERFRELFRDEPLKAPLGVFAIAGNIDPAAPETFAELFRDTGVETIFFSTILVNLGAEQGLGPVDVDFLSVVDSVEGVQDRGFTETGNFLIMVGHYPNFAIRDYRDATRTPDLMLAGHTHGGQVALPFYGPIRIKFTGREAIIPQDMMSGRFTFPSGGTFLISRGSGMERGWAPRVRFFCRPEISVIDLVPSAAPERAPDRDTGN